MNESIAVVGAGSWGTALALLFASKGLNVNFWGFDKRDVENILKEKENKKYLPGFRFPGNIFPTDDIQAAVLGCNNVCMVVPSHGFRNVFKHVYKHIQPCTRIISATKGIENDTLMTMTQVIEDIENKSEPRDKKDIISVVLSGPSFAKEVAMAQPTAVTIGCREIAVATELQNLLVTETFRIYSSTDVLGIEISAAMKNVIAIATGVCDGLGFGLNTRAALITRGLAEISRLGIAMGAEQTTFSGLSGLGDLVLTCTGDLSRNRTVGLLLGRGGKTLEQIIGEMEMVAEGVKTTKSVYQLAQKLQIEMPILEQMYQILYLNKNCETAAKELLVRELKIE